MEAIIARFYKTLKLAKKACKKDEIILETKRGYLVGKKSILFRDYYYDNSKELKSYGKNNL